jgi:hypothetical protein
MRGLHGLLEIKTFLLVYAVGIELDLSFLLEELVHVGFDGEQFVFEGGLVVMQLDKLVCALPLPACWVRGKCADGVF